MSSWSREGNGGIGKVIVLESAGRARTCHRARRLAFDGKYLRLRSKGSVGMLTRTAGIELAPRNILLAGLGPGATPINLSTMQDPAKTSKLDSAIPLGQMDQPSEIGSVVTLLTGSRANNITASTVFADGGLAQSGRGL